MLSSIPENQPLPDTIQTDTRNHMTDTLGHEVLRCLLFFMLEHQCSTGRPNIEVFVTGSQQKTLFAIPPLPNLNIMPSEARLIFWLHYTGIYPMSMLFQVMDKKKTLLPSLCTGGRKGIRPLVARISSLPIPLL